MSIAKNTLASLLCIICGSLYAEGAKPANATPLDLSRVANMGFVDPVGDDGKGGWTDQGPDNDLRSLKPGKYAFCGLDFTIIDPARNQGKSCLVLCGSLRPQFSDHAAVALAGATFKNLYLLHGSAWTPSGVKEIGKLTVHFNDRTIQEIPVRANADVGNWWNPVSIENGLVVWTGENRQSYVGFYLSKFAVQDKPIERIEITSNGKSVWMILAISGSSENLVLPAPESQPIYIVPNQEWQPLAYQAEILPGSILDFSAIHEAPAGKYGHVIVNHGHFAFAGRPEKRVKFNGTNLCFSSCFLEKPMCDQVAERLSRMGYNAVRFHHFDDLLTDHNDPARTRLNPAELDQLDYLFAALKKRGIYVTIDLYTLRSLPKGAVPEFPNDEVEFKPMMFVSDGVMANWREFSRNLLTHVNPYTGLRWADDPALAHVSLVNEDPILQPGANPLTRATYERKFKEWRHAHLLAGDNVQTRTRFLVDTYNEAYAKMKRIVRDLGVKAPLTDQNMFATISMATMRTFYDYSDIHLYQNHPDFPVTPWKLPSAHTNRSSVRNYLEFPLWMAGARLFGMPLTVTEYDFVAPCSFRAEAGLAIGAAAAFQDWDGIYQFAYASHHLRVERPGTEAFGFFDISLDASEVISEKMIALLYARGDVTAATQCFPFVIGPNYLDRPSMSDYPSQYKWLGLVGQIGTVITGNEITPLRRPLPQGTVATVGCEPELAARLPSFFLASPDRELLPEMIKDKVIGEKQIDLARHVFRSPDGQLTLDQPAGTFQIMTPRNEAAILPEKQVLNGNVLKISDNTAWGTFMAASMDGAALGQSSRVLILHLTEVMNTKAKFSNAKRTMWLDYGVMPYLVRKGTARITLRGNFAGHRLYAVDLSGARRQEIPLIKSKGEVSFTADTHLLENGVVAYELTADGT
jgi:hypothetical protein